MHACVCVCVQNNLWFIATWQTYLILAIQYQHPRVIYMKLFDAEFTISGQLLGQSEKTVADKSMMEQTHLVVSLFVDNVMFV